MLPSTERLTLRRLRPGDAAALHEVLGDPVAMHAYEHGFDEAETAQWIVRQIHNYAADGFGLWAVVLRETGQVIGDCGLTRQDVAGDEVIEVGYHIARAHQGRGYATEAAHACVDWAFTHLGVDDVYAKVRDTNLASMNVAIRLGMTVRRRFTVHYRGVDMPHYAFAVPRTRPQTHQHLGITTSM
jgi:RimJ/RimL family protein N-acetyltransferase